MTPSERCAWIEGRLAELFPETPVPLDHKDPFTLLVAVLLSARCTDAMVNRTTPALFARADTPEDMALVPLPELEGLVRPCGTYSRKAKAIIGLSRRIAEDFGGEVPRDMEALTSLPGVGRKTASVVVSQAFGEPAFPVDTHVHRLAQQWGLTGGESVERTERDLRRRFPRASWNALHLRMIFFGRTRCQARGCDGLRCEVCRRCFPGRRRPRDWNRA